MLKKKIEKVWEDHKGVICFVGGTALVIVGGRYLKHLKKLNAIDHLLKSKQVMMMQKVIEPMFPNEMPIPEIKAALDKIEGAKYFDALAANVNGKGIIFIR